jgi:mannose-6-phosphate isomerase-like protein (cupin superfamily)
MIERLNMAKAVVSREESMLWEIPGDQRRYMGLIFERDITPTKNLASGIVILPVGTEQPKLSVHPDSEEIYYVLKGEGKFELGTEEYAVRKNTAVYIAPGTKHRAINTGSEDMELFWVNTPSCFGPVGGYKDFTGQWKRIQ